MKTRLDSAIDHVAERMVAVPDDPDMAARIVSALPERTSPLRWLIPRFAALGAIAIAVAIWSTRERAAVPAVLPSTEIAAVTALPAVITPREPANQVMPPVERVEPLAHFEPVGLGSDFDRSLPALELSAIGPESLPAVEALTLAPIEIGELPLTAETISSNKFE
jgi:hypothetical protein